MALYRNVSVILTLPAEKTPLPPLLDCFTILQQKKPDFFGEVVDSRTGHELYKICLEYAGIPENKKLFKVNKLKNPHC